MSSATTIADVLNPHWALGSRSQSMRASGQWPLEAENTGQLKGPRWLLVAHLQEVRIKLLVGAIVVVLSEVATVEEIEQMPGGLKLEALAEFESLADLESQSFDRWRLHLPFAARRIHITQPRRERVRLLGPVGQCERRRSKCGERRIVDRQQVHNRARPRPGLQGKAGRYVDTPAGRPGSRDVSPVLFPGWSVSQRVGAGFERQAG